MILLERHSQRIHDYNYGKSKGDASYSVRISLSEKDAEVRDCAFLRGNAFRSERGAVVGNSTELKT